MSQKLFLDDFVVFHNGTNRTWGGSLLNRGTVLHLFGKIIVRPNEETIYQMITKIKEKFKDATTSIERDLIFVSREKSIEQIIFTPNPRNHSMAMQIGAQNTNTYRRFAYWRCPEYLEIQSEKEHKARFDEITEDTQGLIRKDLLLD